jgi:hypothetical protein
MTSNLYTHTGNDAKQDLLIIDAETGLLSHPSTLECVSSDSEILFPNLFGPLARESPCTKVVYDHQDVKILFISTRKATFSI